MNRPFYSEYVRHCMRFYARNTEKPRFNTEVDKNNWYACHRALDNYSEQDRITLVQIYGMRDTIADNVFWVAKAYDLDQRVIWDMIKEFERSVARKRGLL